MRVRILSNIYDGAFSRNSENLSTIFTKKSISDVWRVPKHACASKRFLKLIYNICCYLILNLKFLRKTNFSEYQEMAVPTFLFIKVNYAFSRQNFNPSLLINKTIERNQETERHCFFPFLDKELFDGEDLQLWTKGCRQIHAIKQTRFFYGMFCSWIFVVRVKKLQKLALG